MSRLSKKPCPQCHAVKVWTARKPDLGHARCRLCGAILKWAGGRWRILTTTEWNRKRAAFFRRIWRAGYAP